jgi:hypothetical protein
VCLEVSTRACTAHAHTLTHAHTHMCSRTRARAQAKDFIALGAILTLAFCLFTNVIDVDSDALSGVEA